MIMNLMEKINAFLWNGPILILLSATHIFFTIKIHPQLHLFRAIKLSVSSDSNTSQKGLSCFTTLATTLAATLGTGNIVGVSTAIALGGPGALFWCFLTGLLGMATAYAECYLSCLYRIKEADGHYAGGPMHVWEQALHSKTIGKVYAFCVMCAALGAGCTTQSSAMADAALTTFRISPYITGFAAAIIAGLVILGGVKSIGKFCTRLVPPLGILYIVACLFLLWQNRSALLPALSLILTSAFTGKAAAGGFIGSTFLIAARFGIARGLFTNEAGIGTSAIAAGASGTDAPERQALISMTAVFWDTIVMCTLTGFTIVTGMLRFPGCADGYTEAGLTSAVFHFFPIFGNGFLTVTLIFFALATLVGWCYIGEKGVVYLFGETGARSYHLVYIVMIYLGAILPMQFVWHFTDFINAVMVVPNVLCLFLLSKKLHACRFTFHDFRR